MCVFQLMIVVDLMRGGDLRQYLLTTVRERYVRTPPSPPSLLLPFLLLPLLTTVVEKNTVAIALACLGL